MLRVGIAIVFCLLLIGCRRQQAMPTTLPAVIPPLPTAIVERSLFSQGNPARLDRVMQKARAGQPITIGFFGGSITHGQGASSPDRCYASQVANWWINAFPRSKVTQVNAGLNGTGSGYGCLRVQQDLLSAHPDFVVVEFGVNDRNDLAHAETYEGVVRQILASPDQPAVLLLFTMHHDGTNAQPLQGEVGQQYQLPMISFRDAVWPEISAGRMKWSDFFFDVIHPNDRGHAGIAQCVNSFLQNSLDHLPAKVDDVPPLQSPRFTDWFARVQLIRAENLVPISAVGWTLDTANHCWKSTEPGSVIEFDTTGPIVDLLYARVSPSSGIVSVTVDGQSPVQCDAWFDGTWEGYPQPDLVARDLKPGVHQVRIQLLNEVSGYNKLGGHEFRVLGLGEVR